MKQNFQGKGEAAILAAAKDVAAVVKSGRSWGSGRISLFKYTREETKKQTKLPFIQNIVILNALKQTFYFLNFLFLSK